MLKFNTILEKFVVQKESIWYSLLNINTYQYITNFRYVLWRTSYSRV